MTATATPLNVDDLLAAVARPPVALHRALKARVGDGQRSESIASDQGARNIVRRYIDPVDAEWNVLAAFAATGEITAQTSLALVEAMPPSAHRYTEALIRYVCHHGVRGPVEGWSA